MKDATLVKDATSKALLDLLAILPAEVRLAGLQPEQTILALPESFLATLPADVQAAVRARLAR